MQRHFYACFRLFLIAAIPAAAVWAEAPSRPEIDALYSQYESAFDKGDLDAVMTLYSDEFQAFGGVGHSKKDVRAMFQMLFDEWSEMDITLKLDRVIESDNKTLVFGSVKLNGKNEPDGRDRLVDTGSFVDAVIREDGGLRFVSSGQLDTRRNRFIKDAVYANEEIGFSVASPEGWEMIPLNVARMDDGLIFLAEGGHMPGFFGRIEIPYNLDAKQAVAGDDSVTRKMTNDYRAISAKPVKINDLKGYESVSSFSMKNFDLDEMKRKRVYLESGGLLYVFVLTVPTEHYDKQVKPFDSMVASFELSDEARTAGAQRARAKDASGEIMGRIYSNAEFGCQIAAPQGWTIENTPLPGFKVSMSMKPASGDSLVRLLAQSAPIKLNVNDIFDRELEGIKTLVEKYEMHSEPSDIQLAGQTGRTAVYSFQIEGLGHVKRRSIMVTRETSLFIILCDAIPPEQYAELSGEFDAIVNSFTLN